MHGFSEPEPNVIKHLSGFSVKVLGRTGILYSENDRTIHVDSEVLASPGIVIYTKSIRSWDSPFQDIPLTIDDKKRIIKNICDAINYKGEYVDVS